MKITFDQWELRRRERRERNKSIAFCALMLMAFIALSYNLYKGEVAERQRVEAQIGMKITEQ